MPVIRRDESSDPLGPHILLLWQRKWLIVGVAIAAAVLTYVALLFVGSSYRVNAEIFVNRLPSVPEGETPNPDTVMSLLKSQHVLEQVRNDYVAEYEIEQPPKIEEFVKAFSVESTVLQDTTVRKELSPVLQLEVEAKGQEATRFIMESWIRNFIAQFGNYTVNEAVVKRDAYLDEKNKLEQQALLLSREKADIDARLPYARKLLAEKLDLLSPSRLRASDQLEENTPNTVEFIVQSPRMMPGLLERYSELQLRQRAGTLPTTGAAELKAIELSIQDATTSVAEVQKQYADLLFENARVEREINLITETRAAINDAITRFSVASAVYIEETSGTLPAGGDIRALTMPVTPEARVWPKRTMSALVAAIVAGIFTVMFVLGNSYLRRLSQNARQETP